MATLTLSAWEDDFYSTEANVLSNQAQVYALRVYKRAPEKPAVKGDITGRCRKDRAVGISCFIAEVWQGGVFFSLAQTAVWLAKLGLSAGDLENFFQAAEMMGWEDGLISQAVAQAQPYLTDEGDTDDC